MAKSDREPIAMYRVWNPELESEDDGKEYGALDVARAAQVHATYWAQKNASENYEAFPITLHVKDPTDSHTYAVDVNLSMVPEFRPGKPVKLR